MLRSVESRASAVGLTSGLVAYLAALWDLGVRPLRITSNGAFAHFYDVQARALMHGHVDVPPGSLGIEEFVVRGRSYMYFPPFPALLRMPILAVTDRFDGRLTAVSMLAGWLVFATCAAALVWRIRRLITGDRPVSRLDGCLAALVLALVTGGAPITFLASRPFVFHEVYIWNAALALAVVLSVLRTVERPSIAGVVLVAALTTALVLTRAPAGWVTAIAIVGLAVWIRVTRAFGDRSRTFGRLLTTGSVVAVVIGASINWIKFHHAFRFPIDEQVWSRINPARQASLAANGGRLDGLQFVWTTLTAYFRPDGIRFSAYPPFVSLPARPPAPIGGVTLDQTYRTASITSIVTLLFVLAVWGIVVLSRRRRDDHRDPLRILFAGTIVATGPVLAFSYIAFRYTAEFVPALLIGSAVGIADIGPRLERATPGIRRVGIAGVAALGAIGLVSGWAVGVGEARIASGGARLEGLIAARDGFGGAHLVRQVTVLPDTGAADEVAVVGDCDAVYVGTGDPVDPWRVVAVRGLDIRIRSEQAASPGVATIARFASTPSLRRSLDLELGSDGRYRLVVRASDGVVPSSWFDLADGVTLSISADSGLGGYRIDDDRSGAVLDAVEALTHIDDAGIAAHVLVEMPGATDLAALARLGVDVDWSPRDDMQFCERLTS